MTRCNLKICMQLIESMCNLMDWIHFTTIINSIILFVSSGIIELLCFATGSRHPFEIWKTHTLFTISLSLSLPPSYRKLYRKWIDSTVNNLMTCECKSRFGASITLFTKIYIRVGNFWPIYRASSCYEHLLLLTLLKMWTSS